MCIPKNYTTVDQLSCIYYILTVAGYEISSVVSRAANDKCYSVIFYCLVSLFQLLSTLLKQWLSSIDLAGAGRLCHCSVLFFFLLPFCMCIDTQLLLAISVNSSSSDSSK